jgi:hypothetical protein
MKDYCREYRKANKERVHAYEIERRKRNKEKRLLAKSDSQQEVNS